MYAVAIAVTVGTSYIAWQRQALTAARILTVLLVAAATWSLCIIGLILTDSAAVYWGLLVVVIATGGISVTGWVLFAIDYTDSWPTSVRHTVALLSVEPVVAVVATAATVGTDLTYVVSQTGDVGPTGFALGFGPIFVLHVVYSYAVFSVGIALVFRFVARSRDVFRQQATALAVAALPPFAAHVLFFVGVIPIDVTPVGFTLTGVVLLFATRRMGLMDVTPVARDEVVQTIHEAVFVLDYRDRIVDVNPRGAELLGTDRADLVGRPLDEVVASMPGYREEIARIIEDRGGEMTVSMGGELRDLSVQMSPLYDRHDRLAGRVFVARDVTAQKRRQRELERKNEQLDRFASVVSHDLRNPLNVASGRARLAAETGEASHAEAVTDALDRMEDIIDDILTLAREGQTIDETERVSLASVAENAWDHVDTAEATLSVTTDRTVDADPARLQRLFENLFRNCIEHGGADVAVTVGDTATEDGFYVADDGPGIPPEERDTVLEHGYTRASDGTGLGLAIVDSIAQAHGWKVEVTESDRGGAQFEVLNAVPVAEVEKPDDGGLSLFRDDDGEAARQAGDG
jgi:PAS domain S-box-containing protein